MTGDDVATVLAIVLGAVVITPMWLRHRASQAAASRKQAAKQTEAKP